MADLVILVGFRGVGKTTIGRKLAEVLDYAFFDTDAEIVRRCGEDIADIVAKEGWPAFRRYEGDVLASLASLSHTVVATGGGAVLHEDIWRTLPNRAAVIWLSADEGVIMERIAEDAGTSAQRPPLSGKDSLAEIFAILRQRRPLYEQIAHYTIDTGILNVEEAIEEIGRCLANDAV